MHKIRLNIPTAECSIACHTSNAARKTKRNCISVHPGWETSSKANTVRSHRAGKWIPVNRWHLIFFFTIYKSGNHFLLTMSFGARVVLHLMSAGATAKKEKKQRTYSQQILGVIRLCATQKTAYATNADLKIRKLSLLVLL